MSILVEAVTLVVRRMTLDTSYPGGAEAWIRRHEAGGMGARYVSADRHLVGVSLLNEAAEAEVGHLIEMGLVFVDEDAFQEFATVDQERGLSWPCGWLHWSRTDGEHWSTCWLMGTEPGELAVPAGWTPGQEELVASDLRLRPGMMRLGSEPGKEHWLDTTTGLITTHGTRCFDPIPGPMLERLRSWLEERGIDYSVSPDGIVVASVVLGQVSARLWAHAAEGPRILVVSGVLPFHVPEHLEEPLLEALSEWSRFEVDGTARDLEARLVIELEEGWEGPTPEFMEDVMAHLDRMARAAREVWTHLVADEPGDWGVHEVMAIEFPLLPDVKVSYERGFEGEAVVLVPTIEHAECLARWAVHRDSDAWYVCVTRVELAEEPGLAAAAAADDDEGDGDGDGHRSFRLFQREEGDDTHWLTPVESAVRDLRAAVAGNPSLPEEMRERMAREDFPSIADVASGNGPGTWSPGMKRRDAAPREDVPLDPGALPDFEALIRDPRQAARVEAASHPGAPPDVLEKLAGDPSWRVRRAVARNPSTSSELLYRLVEHGTPTILKAIAGRGDLRPTFVDFLLALGREEVTLTLILEQDRLSDGQLRVILECEDPGVLAGLCRRHDLPLWVVHHLARMERPPWGLEEHPSLSPALLRLLSVRLASITDAHDRYSLHTYYSWGRLEAIASNPSTPTDVLRALARLGAPVQGEEP